MAAALLDARLDRVAVASAGLDAPHGEPAADEAVAAMRARGVDIATHRATRVSAELCRKADLILVMSRMQQREIEWRYPFARGRVFLWCEHDGRDVFDPMGESADRFDACCALIEEGVAHWAERIGEVARLRPAMGASR